jgi:uncharacterized protein
MSLVRMVLVLLVFGLLLGCSTTPSQSAPPPVSQPRIATPTRVVIAATPMPTIAAQQPTVDVAELFAQAIERALKDAAIVEATTQVRPLLGAPSARTHEADYYNFVSNNINVFWTEVAKSGNWSYLPPKLVYVTTPTFSMGSCIDNEGNNTVLARGGPLYCPRDETIYMTASDLWSQRFNIEDFSLAYVLAHEYGHHVQKRFGLYEHLATHGSNYGTDQQISIMQELQADCLAGLWARNVYQQGILEQGEKEAAIAIALQIGDDSLGFPPAVWGHGSSIQRMAWFNHGYTTGMPQECNPFRMGMYPPGASTQTTSPQPQAQQLHEPITDFFIHASDPQCTHVDDGSSNTTATIRCPQNGFNVDFDLWESESIVTNYFNVVKSDREVWLEDQWHSDVSGAGGRFIAWQQDGLLILMWSVWGKPLSGQAYMQGNDLDTLLTWFMEKGSYHYYSR